MPLSYSKPSSVYFSTFSLILLLVNQSYGRFLICFSSTLVIALSWNYFNYRTYYYSTLQNVQTVDFNLLSNTLPTKLSHVLHKNDLEEIQRTVNSSYGLFGIIVTDCKEEGKECNQQIIAKTQSKKPRWNEKQFSDNPYDILRYPIPTTAEWQFDYRQKLLEPKSTGRINKGQVIGRVYYIRGEPPTFIKSQLDWLLYLSESLENLKNGDTEQAHKKLMSFFYSTANSYYFLTNLLGLITGLFVWRFWERIIDKRQVEQELSDQKHQQQLKDEEIERLKVEKELFKISTFNNVFSQLIEKDVSSVIANRLQNLNSILHSTLTRIDSDVRNIIHDIYKAPLLGKEDSTSKIIENIESRRQDIQISDELIEFLKEIDETVKSLNWIVKELRGVTRLKSERTLVHEEIKSLIENLPPTLKEWDIEFNDFENLNLSINCNPWHLRSIVKNALYNSSSALKKHRRNLSKLNNDFHGHISIKYEKIEDKVVIQIEDNGPGIPSNLLSTLYESPEQLNIDQGEFAGNGSMIVYAYLTLHDGIVKKLNLESGARVSFYFPLVDTSKS